MLIGLQAGHQNIQSNSIVSLRSSTGAPGEVDFNVRIRDRLGAILISKGFQVQLDDANANSSNATTGKDFDFYLAIHYDANIYGTGGGCVSPPDPSADLAHTESKRIVDFIRQSYFVPYTQDTGIVEHPERVNANMTYYYMWNYLTGKTPCGLIECGVGTDAHDAVILADTDRVCNAIAKGICKAFNVPWEPVPPPPTTTSTLAPTYTTNSTSTSTSTVTYTVPNPPEGDGTYQAALYSINKIVNHSSWWTYLGARNKMKKILSDIGFV